MKANQGKCGASSAPGVAGGDGGGGQHSSSTPPPTPMSSLSAQALEYYRMYAVSEELPKYFSGNYVLPTDRQRTTTPPPPSQLEQQVIPEIVVEVCASPTSSIVSKEGRKQLEWDSGADIGYHLQKSISMPLLDDDVPRQPSKPLSSTDAVTPPIDGASGDAPKQHKVKLDKHYDNHHQVMSFLRRKVGLPIAESTPLITEIRKSGSDPAIYSQTPKIPAKTTKLKTKESQQLNTTIFNYEVPPSSANVNTPQNISTQSTVNRSDSGSMLPNKTLYFRKYRSGKLENLQVAPPVVLECLSNVITENSHTQTSLNEIAPNSEQNNKSRQSIGIQTSRRLSKQEIIYLFHPDMNINFDKSGKSSSSTTTTTSRGKSMDDVFLNCNSFEYLHVHGSADFEQTALISEDAQTSQSVGSIPIDKSDKSSEVTSSLSKDLSSNMEKLTASSCNEELGKSLRIMKKLIKSDKYDDDFKQRYLRKIAQKLIASPVCQESSNSSTRVVNDDSDKMVENNPNLQNVPTTSGTNWKDSLTMSERLYSSLEKANKTDGSTDPKEYLVNFAKRERENQLSWINDEIEHLAKLKSLLETKKEKSTKTVTAGLKVPVNKMADYKKSTSVYVITTERQDGDTCGRHCATKTVKSVTGEIDFHVHNSLGVRDYKFKEIITRITPREDAKPSRSEPWSNLGKRSTTKCDPVDSVSERRPGTPCRRPSGSFGDKTCPSGGGGGGGGGRRARDKLATLPTLHVPAAATTTTTSRSRSRSRTPPSSKSSSNTDETSGYPTRRRHHHHRPTGAHGRRITSTNLVGGGGGGGGGKRHAVVEKKQPALVTLQPSAAVVSDSDTDSSHYESLPKYQNHSLTGSRQKDDRPKATVAAVPPPVPVTKFYARNDYGSSEPQECGGLQMPSPSGGGVGSKKDSYKHYKATKQKEKEQQQLLLLHQEGNPRRSRDSVVDKVGRKHMPSMPSSPPTTKTRDRRHNIERHQQQQRRPSEEMRCTWTSDAEPLSISEDELKHYRMHNARRAHDKRRAPPDTPPPLPSPPLPPPPLDCPSTTAKASRRNAKKKSAPHHGNARIGDAQEPPARLRHGRSDTDDGGGGGGGKRIDSKSDSDHHHSFERCTNTEGPWRDDDEEGDDVFFCNEPLPEVRTAITTATGGGGAGVGGASVFYGGDAASCKPSKTGTVSLQTIHPPTFCERGVMKLPDEQKVINARDIQVGTEAPLMKQICVGDDVKHTAKETASQIPQKAPGSIPRSGLSLTPASVVTYMPHLVDGGGGGVGGGVGGCGSITGADVRPYKMVKDMSKINLNSAVIISSVVTSSVSNPEDNIRRLVLEMPLTDAKENTSRSLKRCDKKKDTTVKESSVLSTCSCCLQSSSSRLTTTAGSSTDMMCSCCGKCVISTENIAPPGSGAPFCWPCYCNTNRPDWPPLGGLPLPVVNAAQPDTNFYPPPPPMYAPQQPPPVCEDNALEKIRDTLRQLAEIDNEEEVVGGSGGGGGVGGMSGSGVCGGGGNRKDEQRLVCNACNKKIKHRSARDTTLTKKPVAYVLKFEPGEEHDEDKSEPQSLQEIRVKLPHTAKTKVGCSGGGVGGGGGGGMCGSGGGGRKKQRAANATGAAAGVVGNKSGEKDDAVLGARNLQDYLTLNRPDFMASAEGRRRFLVEMAYMREQRCRRYKDLLDLPLPPDGEACKLDPKSLQKRHLFTTKEMKRMTAKNYKHLPEVQEKVLNNKRERIKKTNKFLVNIFNKKLKETVLRGQASLSTRTSVINM